MLACPASCKGDGSLESEGQKVKLDGVLEKNRRQTVRMGGGDTKERKQML